MKVQLEKRLNELRSEFESGQKTLAELEAKQTNLRNTLFRISGAIQVLEEELRKSNINAGEALQQSNQKSGVPVEPGSDADDGKETIS
jgi:predicted  nucleic acid-binding Zn-ribbon protein